MIWSCWCGTFWFLIRMSLDSVLRLLMWPYQCKLSRLGRGGLSHYGSSTITKTTFRRVADVQAGRSGRNRYWPVAIQAPSNAIDTRSGTTSSCRRILEKSSRFPVKATDSPALSCNRERRLDLRNVFSCPEAGRTAYHGGRKMGRTTDPDHKAIRIYRWVGDLGKLDGFGCFLV